MELVLGPVLFIGAIVLLSFGIGAFDFVIARWVDDTGPTLGLSGVVMGMLGLFVYFLPRAKIRFFYWFMLSVGTIGIPALLVAIWYVGWDLYYQLSGTGDYINFVAHLAGAAFGLGIGVVFFRNKRYWTKDLVLESVDLTRDESRLATLNGVMAGTTVAGFAFLAGLVVILVVYTFVRHFWLAMLLAAPAVAAAYQIYRSRRADRPRRETYLLGVEALERGEYDRALKLLDPLAQQNDTRALYALANLYAAGRGRPRDEAKAFDLCRRAAERGHAEAQYRLGTFYADGRGTEKNVPQALEWYRKAADGGVAEAANSLGYLYEHAIGIPRDVEQAIEWYYRAAVAFHKKGRSDDASAAIRHLENLAAEYPAVLGLVTKLKLSVALRKG